MEDIKYLVLNDINQEIRNLRKEVFVIEQNVPPHLEWEDDESIYKHCCLYLNNKLIAYARVDINKEIAHIGRVVVAKEYRKQGYGKKIMQYSEEIIKKGNKSSVEIHAQLHASEFYKSIGYIPYDKEFMEAGIRHIKMKKILK